MSASNARTGLQYLCFAILMLLLSNGVGAAIITGPASVQDYEQTKGQPKRCIKLPSVLDATQLYYGDFMRLEGAPKGAAETSFQPQPMAITTTSQTLCFNELRFGYRYQVTFREGFPLNNGDTFRQTIPFSFDIPPLETAIEFQNNSLILPTIGGPKVPITLTNTGVFAVKVFRLSESQIKMHRGLQGLRLLSKSEINSLGESADLVAQQDFDVVVPSNLPTTFNLDLAELVDTQKVGIYVLVVESDDLKLRYWDDRPTQYVMFTDIGLSSYRGVEGLRVYARSYASANAMADIQIDLIAENQEVLQTLTTNAQGFVDFSLPMMSGQGGLKPIEIKASNSAGLVSYLALTGQQMDLADRPVAGAEPLGLFNAYLFTERGVYRPGEDVVLSGLVRNKNIIAPINVPLTLQIVNAQGKVQFTQLIGYLEQGGLQHRFTVPKASKTGLWAANLYFNTADEPIGSVAFSVEDYIPETLAVSLTNDHNGYTDQAIEVALQSDYLYGAPAAKLAVSAQLNLTPVRRLFTQRPAYVFGHYGDATVKKVLQVKATNDQGQALITLPANLLNNIDPNQAHWLKVTAGVTEPSGREVRARLQLPVLNHDSWVGVRVNDEAQGFDRDANIAFNLLNISAADTAINAGKIHYKVIEEDWDYHWYYNNSWKYTINRFDKSVVTSGTLTTNDHGLARLELGTQTWGRYRLEVTDIISGQSTQLRYRVGWWNAAGAQSALPDQVKMALSQAKVTAGEQVKLQIKPPYAGKLHLLIANQSILQERVLDIPAEGMEVVLDVQQAFGPDVYLMANVYRPGHQGAGPARAVGISYLSVEQPQLMAHVEIIAPKKTKPNQAVDIEVHTNLPAGSRVVLAAVDEGILKLTGYKSPSPLDYFLAKRRLSLGIMDLYGHLIQHQDGESLRVHFGGDGDAAGGSDVAPLSTFVKPLAVVSDLAPVNAQGKVTISLDLPQFNGQVRLMAVAFNAQQMGAASEQMIIRDAVVVQPIMPRFMSVGDQAQIGVSLHNLELPDGDFTLNWAATDNFELSTQQQSINLAHNERANIGILVNAQTADTGRIGATLTKPDGDKQYYHWDLTALTNRFVEEYESSVFLAAGTRGTISNDVDDLTLASRQLKVQVTNAPLLATDWLAQSLSRYPFGCLEQTTSKAWPLLYITDNKAGWNKAERTKHMAKAINHIGQMQLSSGAFSLWRGGNQPQPWLSMYAIEFLQEAKAKGYSVPAGLLAQAMAYVENLDVNIMSVNTYAMYLRTKYGNADPGEARYLASQLINQDKDFGVQSHVHLATTFGLLGDEPRAREMLSHTRASSFTGWARYDYRTELRDQALYSFYALQSDYVDTTIRANITQRLEGLFAEAKSQRYLSTHEKSWLLRLASLSTDAKPLPTYLPISLDFKDAQLKDLSAYLIAQASWTSAKNTSNEDMYIKVSSSGVNKGLTDKFANKMIITTAYKDLATGQDMPLIQVHQGTDVMVTHTIEIDKDLKYDMELSIEAPVPAGFELENPRLSSGRALVTKVSRLKPNFEEYRDDRYVGAWSLNKGHQSAGINNNVFHVAYVMRAVTPGSYLVPAIAIEDMYQPKNRANTAESHVVVVAK